MEPDRSTVTLASAVVGLAGRMLRLPPGELARLRRMDPEGPGSLAFWRLSAASGLLDRMHPSEQVGWAQLVRILALLTPRGEESARGKLHDVGRPLGAVLCDGGERSWRGERPAISEARLARFLALPVDRRAPALERMVRALALGGGIDCVQLARLVLVDGPEPMRRVAETYYRRLDRARAVDDETQEDEEQ